MRNIAKENIARGKNIARVENIARGKTPRKKTPQGGNIGNI
ncbi:MULTISPECIES: hypothetical protein [unclassified Helicobacter]|nr:MULTISPECIES: hypothetical protein [unclassified Helicobacter]